MKFTPTEIAGVVVVELDLIEDERGHFARTWCRDEFAENGLNPGLSQCSISWTRKKGTVRGMHWQASPHEEAKLVRVTRGAIWDVALDVRPASATFHKWFGIELSANNGKMLYIPEGCAHGMQNLEDETEVFYQISTFYQAGSARGLRFDDPTFNIEWPLPVSVIAEKDKAFPFVPNGASLCVE